MSDTPSISSVRRLLQQLVEKAQSSYHQHAPSGKGLSRHSACHKGILTNHSGFGVMAWDQTRRGIFSRNNPPWIPATLPFALQRVKNAFQDMTVGPGDIFLMNDPYDQGVHPREVMLFSPLFAGSHPVLWIGASLLWPDFGGMTRGGYSTRQSETEQQGLRISPLLLMEKGKLNKPILDLISSNIRDPQYRRRDLRCAINSFQIAQKFISDHINPTEVADFQDLWQQLRQREDQYFQAILAQGDTDFTGEGDALLDSDGFIDQPIRLLSEAKLIQENKKFKLSLRFPEIPPITLGPRNMPKALTIAACADALAQLFPQLDQNICFDHLLGHIDIPENSFYDAPYPAPICAQDWSGYFALRSSVRTSLSAVLPAENPALVSQAESATAIGEIGFFGQNSDASPFALQGYLPGGQGACHMADGQSASFPDGFAPKALCPEQMERQAPITVTDFSLRVDSSGLGEYLGGSGVFLRFRLNEGAGYVTLRSDQGQWGPSGIDKGLDAAPTEVFIEDQDSEVRHRPWLASREDAMMLETGDSFSILTPGGGGYGPTAKRPAEKIAHDLAIGRITQQYLDDYREEDPEDDT